jgi:hypothetical protein
MIGIHDCLCPSKSISLCCVYLYEIKYDEITHGCDSSHHSYRIAFDEPFDGE